MSFTNKNKIKCFSSKQTFCLMIGLSVVLSLLCGKTGLAAENENVQYYKMLSAIEYSGKKQFRNQIETLFTVRKQPLSDDKTQYFISSGDFELVEGNLNPEQQSSSGELSFVIDRKTRHLLGATRELSFLEMVNNQCVSSLKKVTKENIGKTWKQSFDLSFLGNAIPGELKFTLTAIQLKTDVLGEMIAVRALSEPFVVKAMKEDGELGSIQSRINAAYLFDSEIEDIYLSISVFDAKTKLNGFKETLRHEVATYRTDAAGVSVDLNGLGRMGKKFEKFVRKLGLTTKRLKVVEESPLPQWVQSDGLVTTQIANICAAMACEGSSNPVATVSIPVARTVALQGIGKLATAEQVATVSSMLVKSVPGVGGMKIAVAPAFMGVGLGTAGAAAGGTAGAVAVAGAGGGGSSGGSSARSPSSP